MKKFGLIVGFALVGLFLMTNNAMAVLYYPDLLFDNTGVAAYDATTKKLTVTADSEYIVFDNSLTKSYINHSFTDDVLFYAEYVSGGYGSSSWIFQGNSHISPDIEIYGKLSSPPSGFGDSGTLILGDITSLSFDGVDRLQGTFDIITGGDLYNYYAYTGYKGMFDITLEFSGE